MLLLPLYEAKAAFERLYIVGALITAQGARTKCAKTLGISRKHLWEKIRDHKIEPHEYETKNTTPAE